MPGEGVRKSPINVPSVALIDHSCIAAVPAYPPPTSESTTSLLSNALPARGRDFNLIIQENSLIYDSTFHS